MNGDILDELGNQPTAPKIPTTAPTDPLTAAMGAQAKPQASFFPASENPSFTSSPQGKFKFGQNSFTNMLLADDRKDLMRDTDNIFYGGGNVPAPTPTPTQPPQLLAGLPRRWQGPATRSTDLPNSAASISELASPPKQIPLNQFPPSEGDKQMQSWYEDLTNRMMARRGQQGVAQISF